MKPIAFEVPHKDVRYNPFDNMTFAEKFTIAGKVEADPSLRYLDVDEDVRSPSPAFLENQAWLPFLFDDLVMSPAIKDSAGRPLICRVADYCDGKYLLVPLEAKFAKPRLATEYQMTLVERGEMWIKARRGQH